MRVRPLVGAITLAVNGELVPYDATGASGWMWGDRVRGEVVFRGAACAALAAAASASVEATVLCGETTAQ